MFEELLIKIARVFKEAGLPYVIVHKIFAGRPRDLEDVHAIVIKNPGFGREYVRTWLREFDGSFEDAGFVEVFENMLRKKGPIGV